jgi:hypothetical protein
VPAGNHSLAVDRVGAAAKPFQSNEAGPLSVFAGWDWRLLHLG